MRVKIRIDTGKDAQEIARIASGIKGKVTILKCNVRERWNTIDTVAALSPSAVRFMTIYSNDTYLGRFDELTIDSARVNGYRGDFLLFKKTGK